MSAPGEGELTGAHRAHGGPQVWGPDGGSGTQRSPDVWNHVRLQEETQHRVGVRSPERRKLTFWVFCFELLMGKSSINCFKMYPCVFLLANMSHIKNNLWLVGEVLLLTLRAVESQ